MQLRTLVYAIARLAIVLMLACLQLGCLPMSMNQRLAREGFEEVAAEVPTSDAASGPRKRSTDENVVDAAVDRGKVAKEIRDVLSTLQSKHNVPPSEIEALEQLLMESDPVLRATLLRQYQLILSGQQNIPYGDTGSDTRTRDEGRPSYSPSYSPREYSDPAYMGNSPPSNATPNYSPPQRPQFDRAPEGYDRSQSPDYGDQGYGMGNGEVGRSQYASHKPRVDADNFAGDQHVTRAQFDQSGLPLLGQPGTSAHATGNAVTRSELPNQNAHDNKPVGRSREELSAAAKFLRSQQMNNLATSDPSQMLASGFGSNNGMTEVHQMLEQMAATVRREELQEASLVSWEDPKDAVAASAADDESAEPSPKEIAEQKSWQELLANSINTLEAELSAAHKENDSVKVQSLDPVLRILYACAGERDAAGREVAADSNSIKQYWRELALTLDTQLNNDNIPSHRKELLVLRGLRDAVRELAEQSHLDIRNLAFCQQVDSFGRYKTFKQPYEFQAGQEVLLYVEVENMMAIDVSDSTETKYEVSLRGHYDIFDATGRRVAEHQFPADAESCRNRRQDFYIPYRMYIPGNLGPGKYTLHLHMEDTHAQKIAESAPLEFLVK